MLMTDRAVVDPDVGILVYGRPERHSLQSLPCSVGGTMGLQESHMSPFERISPPRHTSPLATATCEIVSRHWGRWHHRHPYCRLRNKYGLLQHSIDWIKP
eukprot:3852123-Karenia_brevis.AAC.1